MAAAMNRIAILVTTLALTAAACGKKTDTGGKASAAEPAANDKADKADKAGDDKADKGGDDKAGDDTKAPTLTINEADWVVKNLNTVSPLINISMKVPKDAKLEKNGNGGVDVTISSFYMLTVSQLADSKIADAVKDDKSLTINNASTYINGKVITEEPKGFVYSMQMKDEENGTKYQPEAHFAVYLDKDGAIYSILDKRPLGDFDKPGSTYTEALAKQVYGIVKGSAKVN
jgi:hypothetical protein